MDKMRNNLSDTGISRNPAGRIRSSAAEYLTFVASTGGSDASFEMRYEDENIWLTQKMMAALYDVSVSAINQHLKKVFEDAELQENSVIKKYLITAEDGKKYNTKHYNLQAIIAVGFKVNNQRAVQFRKWAGQIVRECEYEKYRVVQDHLYESDFDKFLLKEEGTKMSEFIFVCYPRCTTCKKAEKWLADNGIEVQVRDIKENNPTEQEIRSWHEKSGLPLKRFFNTSGLRYKELELKNKLPAMSEEEQYALLATDGMLVKRPLLVGDDKVLVGFKEKEWQENLL